MNIAINGLFLSSQNTGGGRYLINLVNGLQPIDDIKYSFLVNNSVDKNRIVSNSSLDIVDCGLMTRFRPLRLLWENFILPDFINKRRIDLLHAAGFTLPLNVSCRSVITIFDMTFFTLPKMHLTSKVGYFKATVPLALKKADAIIAISEQTKDDITQYFKMTENKIKVIHIGVGKEFRVIKDKDALGRVKERYGLPEKYILFVGTIEPRKNIKGLIYAYSTLKRRGCEHKLVIVGKRGWGYHDIFKAARDLGLVNDIVFTDYISAVDLPYVYNGASVFVYPSLYEGFGIPVLEAMACGVPVVTSNVSSLPEVAGDAAILINPMDIEEISFSIDKLLRDSHIANTLVKKGFERVNLFSIEKMVAQTMEVYNEVLST